jgi:hypothetical protein
MDRPDNELIARCENVTGYGEDETSCPGLLHFRWGMSQAACDVCGAWCGVAVADWVEVVSGQQREQIVSCTCHLRDEIAGPCLFHDEHLQRARALAAVRDMAFDWYCPHRTYSLPRRDCVECVAEVALDAVFGGAIGE